MRRNRSLVFAGRAPSECTAGFTRNRLLSAIAMSALFVSGLATSALAAEDLRVEVEFFEGDGDTASNRATVWVSGRRVRIEQQGPAGGASAPTFLYRGDRDRLYSIADGAKSYVELEPMLLSLLVGQTRVARREVSGSLEGLPQDQQRAVGHLLGVDAIDPKRPEDPLVVTRTGEVDTVAGLACRRVTLSRSARLLAKGCVADWQTVGLTPADVEVFRSLASLVRDAAGSRAPIPAELVPGQPLDLVVQFGGFPLAFERAGKQAGASAIRVVAVEKVALEDARFEVPKGYAARSGVAGIASLAGLLSIQSGPPSPSVPTASDPEEEAAVPAAMDPSGAAFEPADASSGYRPIRLFDESK
ncbi:hypothetical protein K2X89_05345 [Myxococcota bacterium]|nr:hypothetical protein [Myxococcota bacterium]